MVPTFTAYNAFVHSGVCAVAKRIRLGQARTYSLDDVVSELGLDPATL
jgi:hypothetical protein